jgi:hypothetical protein
LAGAAPALLNDASHWAGHADDRRNRRATKRTVPGTSARRSGRTEIKPMIPRRRTSGRSAARPSSTVRRIVGD